MNLSSQIQLIADKINFDDTNFLKKLEQLISTEESVAFNFMILRSFIGKLECYVYGNTDEDSSIKHSAEFVLRKIENILYIDDMVITPSVKVDDRNDILGSAFDERINPVEECNVFSHDLNDNVEFVDENAPTQPVNIVSVVDAPEVNQESSFDFENVEINFDDGLLPAEDISENSEASSSVRVSKIETFDPSTLSENDVVIDCKIDDGESENAIEAERVLLLKTLINVFKSSLNHNRYRNAFYGEMFSILMNMFSNGRVGVSFSDLEYEFSKIPGVPGQLFISYLNMMKDDHHQDKAKIASADLLLSNVEKDKYYHSLVLGHFLQAFNELFDGFMALELYPHGHSYFFKLKNLKGTEGLVINGMSIAEIAQSELHSAFYARVANISQPHAKSALYRSISGSSLTEVELTDINRNYKEYGLLGLNYEYTQMYDRKYKLNWRLA